MTRTGAVMRGGVYNQIGTEGLIFPSVRITDAWYDSTIGCLCLRTVDSSSVYNWQWITGTRGTWTLIDRDVTRGGESWYSLPINPGSVSIYSVSDTDVDTFVANTAGRTDYRAPTDILKIPMTAAQARSLNKFYIKGSIQPGARYNGYTLIHTEYYKYSGKIAGSSEIINKYWLATDSPFCSGVTTYEAPFVPCSLPITFLEGAPTVTSVEYLTNDGTYKYYKARLTRTGTSSFVSDSSYVKVFSANGYSQKITYSTASFGITKDTGGPSYDSLVGLNTTLVTVKIKVPIEATSLQFAINNVADETLESPRTSAYKLSIVYRVLNDAGFLMIDVPSSTTIDHYTLYADDSKATQLGTIDSQSWGDNGSSITLATFVGTGYSSIYLAPGVTDADGIQSDLDGITLDITLPSIPSPELYVMPIADKVYMNITQTTPVTGFRVTSYSGNMPVGRVDITTYVQNETTYRIVFPAQGPHYKVQAMSATGLSALSELVYTVMASGTPTISTPIVSIVDNLLVWATARFTEALSYDVRTTVGGVSTVVSGLSVTVEDDGISENITAYVPLSSLPYGTYTASVRAKKTATPATTGSWSSESASITRARPSLSDTMMSLLSNSSSSADIRSTLRGLATTFESPVTTIPSLNISNLIDYNKMATNFNIDAVKSVPVSVIAYTTGSSVAFNTSTLDVSGVIYIPGAAGDSFSLAVDGGGAQTVTVGDSTLTIGSTTYALGDTIPFGTKSLVYLASGSAILGPAAAIAQPSTAPPVVPPSGGAAPCFLAGARVKTPSGYSRIETLAVGDHVLTGDGRAVPVRLVKKTVVAAGPTTNPYVIPRGKFGATRRLLISPNHRVSTEAGMVEAQFLGLRQEDRSGDLVYYNLELPDWNRDTMIVDGVTVESLAPVRHVTVTMAEFKSLLANRYSRITPEVLTLITRTCKFLGGGMVTVPLLQRQ